MVLVRGILVGIVVIGLLTLTVTAIVACQNHARQTPRPSTLDPKDQAAPFFPCRGQSRKAKSLSCLPLWSLYLTCTAVNPLFGADAQKDILGTLTEHGVEKAQEHLLAFYPDALDSGEADDVEEDVCQMQE